MFWFQVAALADESDGVSMQQALHLISDFAKMGLLISVCS